jgi:hypothetical protein
MFSIKFSISQSQLLFVCLDGGLFTVPTLSAILNITTRFMVMDSSTNSGTDDIAIQLGSQYSNKFNFQPTNNETYQPNIQLAKNDYP